MGDIESFFPPMYSHLNFMEVLLLIESYHALSSIANEGEPIDYFIHFLKNFDSVQRERLLSKLKLFNLHLTVVII